MTDELTQHIATITGASKAERGERIQSVWSGYGEIVRYHLSGAPLDSVVVKHVKPAKGSGRSHDRKLRSYAVEQRWYQTWSTRCSDACRIPRCLHAQRDKSEWLFVLEDLDAAGFSGRRHDLSNQQLDSCLRWLASFHATFLGERPSGLWKVGTYWHLATRPDEHRSMERGPLRDAASSIDARLSAARFSTLVHGDAKPANFCFSRDGRSVAAVDFQYVGGGCGMKDVAYLLTGEDRRSTNRGSHDGSHESAMAPLF
jgi:aminoglycoside phosphotransferase (APT) family kinase protein